MSSTMILFSREQGAFVARPGFQYAINSIAIDHLPVRPRPWSNLLQAVVTLLLVPSGVQSLVQTLLGELGPINIYSITLS